jgi:hypothetical protein
VEEKLVLFKTAQLAKEKGFNWKSDFYNWYGSDKILNQKYNLSNTILAPTQSLLQKWLDITYNKYVHVEKHTRNGLKCYSPFIDNSPVKEAFFNDYDKSEEALEEGLYEALLLIKIKKDE